MTAAARQPPPATLPPAAVCYAVFVLSGFAGLVYEATWARYLKTILGSEAYAQALVLSIFLGGLAVGAAVAGRWLSRLRHPLVLYAVIEAILGLAAVYFHDLFVAVRSALEGGAGSSIHTRWVAGGLLILPQSVLLGATFPLLAAALVRGRRQVGRVVAWLYFSNSIGGVAGTLAVGFVLVEKAGLPGTMLVAGAASALAAFAAWVVHHRYGAPPPQVVAATAHRAAGSRLRLLLAVAAGTGFASLVYEIIWIRMLALVLGSSTRAFELMLAVFILGLAMGGLYVRKLADREHVELLLAKVQLAMGALVVASAFWYPSLFALVAGAIGGLPSGEAGYQLYWVTGFVLALTLMFLPTFCAGMTLPLITRALMRSSGERALGSVYAWNTVGAIAGIAVAVHVLMPTLGLRLSLYAGAAVDLLLGLLLLRSCWPQRLRYAAAAAALCAVLAVAQAPYSQALLASGIYRTGSLPAPDALAEKEQQIAYYRHGKTTSVVVEKDSDGTKTTIRVNGKSDGKVVDAVEDPPSGNISDTLTAIMLGALGPLHYPEAANATVIGYGTGYTTAVLLRSRNLETVTTLEIEPAVLEGGRQFPGAAVNYEDPRSALVQLDAKTYFAGIEPGTRHVIVSEPSNPWTSGVASLFTVEHFEAMRRALADDGVLIQWLHSYESDPRMFATVLAALGEVFPGYVLYSTGGHDFAIVTSPDLRRLAGIAPDALRQLPALAGLLGKYDIRSVNDAAAAALADHNLLQPYFAVFAQPPNSDYFPVLESLATRAFYTRTHYSLPDSYTLGGMVFNSGQLAATQRREPFAPVTPSRYNAKQQLAAQALALLDTGRDLKASVAEEEVFEAGSVLPEVLFAPQCGADREQELAVAAAAVHLMQSLGTQLYPQERRLLWERLEAEAGCLARITDPAISSLVDFHRAFAMQDYAGAVQAYEELGLEGSAVSSDSEAHSLIMAVLAREATGGHVDSQDMLALLAPEAPAYALHALLLLLAQFENKEA